jgi:hypothetical protein
VVTTGAAGDSFLSMRWTSTTHVALIRGVAFRFFSNGAITSTTAPRAGFRVARSFTVSDSGGAAVTPTRRDSVYPTSLFGDIRASSLAALTPGTRTPEISFYSNIISNAGTGVRSMDPSLDWGRVAAEPIVLRANEGLLFDNLVVYTTGNYFFDLRVEWSEVVAGVDL